MTRPKVRAPGRLDVRYCYARYLRPGDTIRTARPAGEPVDETVRTVNVGPDRVVYLSTAVGSRRYRHAWPATTRVEVVRFNDEPDPTDPHARALLRRQADPHPFDPNRQEERGVEWCAWCALPESAEVHHA